MMDTQTRLLALAHLKNGKKPSDTAEITGITYAAALKLKKELHAAEEKNAILSLFQLNEAALEILLSSVRQQLMPILEAFDVEDQIDGEIQTITNGVSGGKLLNEDFQASARAISNKITTVALTANNAETILSLAKALCELQQAFFGKETVPSGNLPMSSFEQHLRN